MKIIIAPDKFKGSLTSIEVCDAIQKGIHAVDANTELLIYPMADGGDGFAAIMQYYLHTNTIVCHASDPLGRTIKASYEWSEANKTAIIEMAVASGLVLLKENERNPAKTSTHGTGLLIKHAIAKGAKKIILGLGGSATNDAGMGILTALGFTFMDDDNNELSPAGENLVHTKKIIPPSPLPQVSFQVACDVQNTLYGPNGAAYIYGPQKGADEELVKQLDKGLEHFAAVIKQQTGKDVANIPGAGAAGGIAAGLMSYMDVTLVPGMQLIMEASGIKKSLQDVSLIITGEGKIDEQSGEGKVVSVIAKMGNEAKIPVVAISGAATGNKKLLQDMKLAQIETVMSFANDQQEAMHKAAQFITIIAKKIAEKWIHKK